MSKVIRLTKINWIIVIIELNTSDNHRATELIDFFVVSVSPKNGWINIQYENRDQIPSICRILIAAEIEIFTISVNHDN